MDWTVLHMVGEWTANEIVILFFVLLLLIVFVIYWLKYPENPREFTLSKNDQTSSGDMDLPEKKQNKLWLTRFTDRFDFSSVVYKILIFIVLVIIAATCLIRDYLSEEKVEKLPATLETVK